MTTTHSEGYRRSGGKYVHRIVLLEKLGPGTHPCHWCQREVRWEARRGARDALIVDHLDHNRENNDPANLVPTCSSCNSRRQTRQNSPESREWLDGVLAEAARNVPASHADEE